ncbi:MAG: MazG-like family protein [Candidatus Pacearchaeota archaeon]|nr:MazG-like family protein [Candidatus Pacearchaeota archaeon]
MEFQEAIKLAEELIERFKKIKGKPWTIEASMLELEKQVGHLAHEIMVTEKYYPKVMQKEKIDKEKIEDELGDILFSLMRIAKHYNINLEEAHLKASKCTDKFLKEQGA